MGGGDGASREEGHALRAQGPHERARVGLADEGVDVDLGAEVGGGDAPVAEGVEEALRELEQPAVEEHLLRVRVRARARVRVRLAPAREGSHHARQVSSRVAVE